jgi:GGDEF domain-containing protein
MARSLKFVQLASCDFEGHAFHATFSASITEFPAGGQTPQAVLKSAGAGLYQAKACGRNRVEFARQPHSTSEPGSV